MDVCHTSVASGIVGLYRRLTSRLFADMTLRIFPYNAAHFAPTHSQRAYEGGAEQLHKLSCYITVRLLRSKHMEVSESEEMDVEEYLEDIESE